MGITDTVSLSRKREVERKRIGRGGWDRKSDPLNYNTVSLFLGWQSDREKEGGRVGGEGRREKEILAMIRAVQQALHVGSLTEWSRLREGRENLLAKTNKQADKSL